MRRFVCLLLCLLAIAGASAPARADFIKDFRDWQKLGPEGQAAYAMALFDVMTVIVNDDPFTAARAAGLRTCAMALQIKAANVAQAITKFYADHPEARRATPFIAFNGYIERGACSPFINEARKELGLPPMKAPPLPEAPQQQSQPQQPLAAEDRAESSPSAPRRGPPWSPAGRGPRGSSRHARGCRRARCRRNARGPARR